MASKHLLWLLPLSIVLAVALVFAGCLHWPGAPYADAVRSFPPDVAEKLEAAHPGASIVGRVYRTHMESRVGGYGVVLQRFLFEDAEGRSHRGVIDREGRLSTTAVTLLDALPGDIHARFFEREAGGAMNGKLVGRAWSFTDASTKERRYEFEYQIGERRGLGSSDASGRLGSAIDFSLVSD